MSVLDRPSAPNRSFTVGATRALDGNRRLISRQKTSGRDGRSANGMWDRIDGNIAPLAGRNNTAKGQIP